MSDPTTICPGCRELWSTLSALYFCAPQNAHSAKSEGAAPEVAPRATRPDLAAIIRRFEWGCASPQCSDDRAALIVWVLKLERELAEAREIEGQMRAALVNWGEHWPKCARRACAHAECDCGLYAALACGGGEG